MLAWYSSASATAESEAIVFFVNACLETEIYVENRFIHFGTSFLNSEFVPELQFLHQVSE